MLALSIENMRKLLCKIGLHEWEIRSPKVEDKSGVKFLKEFKICRNQNCREVRIDETILKIPDHVSNATWHTQVVAKAMPVCLRCEGKGFTVSQHASGSFGSESRNDHCSTCHGTGRVEQCSCGEHGTQLY